MNSCKVKFMLNIIYLIKDGVFDIKINLKHELSLGFLAKICQLLSYLCDNVSIKKETERLERFIPRWIWRIPHTVENMGHLTICPKFVLCDSAMV